ncbi:hypothetical protein Bca4012_068601 [Brassica carinata]
MLRRIRTPKSAGLKWVFLLATFKATDIEAEGLNLVKQGKFDYLHPYLVAVKIMDFNGAANFRSEAGMLAHPAPVLAFPFLVCVGGGSFHRLVSGLSGFSALSVHRIEGLSVGLLSVSLSFPDAGHGSVLLVLSPVASRVIMSWFEGSGLVLRFDFKEEGLWLFICIVSYCGWLNVIWCALNCPRLDSIGRLQKKMAFMPFELKEKFHEIYCFAFGWTKEKLKQSLN